MLAPTPFDHILFAALALVGPFVDVQIFKRLSRSIASGSTGARSDWYSVTLATEWAAAGCVLALWRDQARPWSALELGPIDSLRFSIGAALAIAYLALAGVQWRAIARRPDRLARLRSKFEAVGPIVPRTDSERRTFVLLAITAGVCEELLFRGFVTSYLANFAPPIAALLLASLAFGFAHVYLGWTHVLRTALVGLVFGIVVWISGSLLPAIAMHAAIDLVSGDLGFRALRTPQAAS